MMERIRCGLCAFGMSGRVFHAPLIKAHPNFELSAVLERTKSEAAKSYPDIKTYRKLKDLLYDEDIDLIIVNVPDHLHFEFCKAALEGGKNVVVEKPFTLTVAEGEHLINLAKQAQLGLFVYQNRRWDSDFLTVRKIIESGRLGQIAEYEAHYDRYRPEPPSGTWKEDKTIGPGLLYNLGAHLIDQALVLFGKPDSVYAEIRKLRKNTGIVDYFNLSLYYPQHTAILKSSYLVKKEHAKYIIHGSKGSFIKPGSDPQEERLKAGWKSDNTDIGLEPKKDWGRIYTDLTNPEGETVKSSVGNYLKFYEGVFEELNGKPGSAVGAGEGLDVIRVIEAASKSNNSGSKILI